MDAADRNRSASTGHRGAPVRPHAPEIKEHFPLSALSEASGHQTNWTVETLADLLHIQSSLFKTFLNSLNRRFSRNQRWRPLLDKQWNVRSRSFFFITSGCNRLGGVFGHEDKVVPLYGSSRTIRTKAVKERGAQFS